MDDAPTPAPTPTGAPSIDAGVFDAAVAIEPTLPARACPPAHAATLGSCSDGLRCVLLLEITDACVVKVVNELEIPDEAIEASGSGIADLAWPSKDGALFLVNMTETWSWAELASPLTAPRAALTKVTWTPTKVGAMEPEGYQYGLVSDGAQALLVGCKTWDDDCSPDAEECEEWFCARHVFVDPHTRKKLARAPALPFVAGAKTGKVTDRITLGKKGKELTCVAGTEEATTFYGEPLDGSIALSATDWLALHYERGSRMRAKWELDTRYMRGCDDAQGIEGRIVLGPNQLWARSTDGGWELQHGPIGAPLTDATGKIKAFGDSFFVFAVD